ncbi:unnamed protein product [Zymoseptoria tritici ST99CH_3D1]|uniref:SigF-like NTF2-like domain-containing protein n=2 Tax=Zymoseptoria tritici TaxID=1047171 RepID=F9XLB8_ZYMTI|nr:uncharacterized protein MYCGRDRAFT_76127 [Zymoseptoria tritici IPO323]EGP83777.1 hypothetical protein MYCGRDRAFT_76127 [Zymoseptoria tritici IPO323]SMQ54550.1 unnamed protein product [Zymoseptoria tritici ST99CH_3D7]SMR62831.1 unnamed protein product [Zymoseptoria tritici ST99CH_3D1]
MDNPIHEITPIVHALTQGTPQQQKDTINQYFTPDASFVHPFCRTGTFDGSRVLIHAIFQWYKVLSPRIEIEVESIAFDEKNLLLYLTIHQVFAIWFVPFYRVSARLTTILTLVRRKPHRNPSAVGGHDHTPNKYYISQQEDLYQVSEFMKFVLPWGVGWAIAVVFGVVATAVCVVGAFLGRPVTRWRQRQRRENGSGSGRVVNGAGRGWGGLVEGVKKVD